MTQTRPSEHAVEAAEMETEIDRLHSRNKKLKKALRGLYEAIEADDGVAWWHMDAALDALFSEPDQGDPAEVSGSLGGMVSAAAHWGQSMRTPDGKVLNPRDYNDNRDALTRDFDAIMTGIRSIRWRDEEWEESGPGRLQRFRRALFDSKNNA